MSEHPSPPAEAALIASALKRSPLSARAAAKKAGISDARWRQITSGYQIVSKMRVPVRAPADTLARMAQVVGVTPEQLAEVGRQDAADELAALPPLAPDAPKPTVEELEARVSQLEQQLAEVLDEMRTDRKRRSDQGEHRQTG